ncbi:MAG TPA: hypothetical protein VKB45_09195 [Gemmatimonadales bacterium]|nr:hypothetical protein [Gemmatimonadales bacterium]
MFIGHFAVGFASKRVAPKSTLAVLLGAPLLADLLWPIFLLLGIERVEVTPSSNPFLNLTFVSYPWSHSLVMGMVWAALFAGAYYGLTRYRRGATMIAIGVVSHWVLDVITHRPDMPVSPWSARLLGFGLWESVPATVLVESLMFIAGIWIYTRCTSARDRVGRYAWWGLVAFTTLGYVVSLLPATPPSVTAIGWTALSLGMLTAVWAWWADRHRQSTLAS